MKRTKGRERCGANLRSGKGKCRQKAGWGTDHPGFGRCKLHAGSTPTGKIEAQREAESPLTYEELVTEATVSQLVSELKRRSDVLDLTEDLALARAVAIDFVNRASELEQALLRWNASWHPDWQAAASHHAEEMQIAQMEEDWVRYNELAKTIPDPLRFMDRPRKVLDLAQAVKMLRDVAGIVSEIVKQRDAGSIPARDVEALLVELANAIDRTVREHVGDVAARSGLLASLERAFATLRLPSWETDADGALSRGEGGRERALDA